jgi:hypothetical protein
MKQVRFVSPVVERLQKDIRTGRGCRSGFSAGTVALLLFLLPFFFVSPPDLYAADVALAWDANSESDLSGYKVYYGTGSRAYGTPISLGRVTSHTVTGLGPGTYYFAITAYNSTGLESGFSNEVSTTISGGGDTTPPVISSISATPGTTSAVIRWTTNEASDSQVYYGTTTALGSQTTLDSARVTSHTQTISGLTSGRQYHYSVRSRDAAGNLATSSTLNFTTTTSSDTTAPTVTMTAPSSGTVSGTITVSATATDNVGVAGVQFLLDGAALLSEDTTSPYSISWNTTSASNGSHTLSARARDAAGNTRTSATRAVTVSNSSQISGLVLGFAFDEASGSTTADSSGSGNTGTLTNVTRTTTARFGRAVSFNGTSSYIRAGINRLPAANAAQTIAWWQRVTSNPTNVQNLIALTNRARGSAVVVNFRNSRIGISRYDNTFLASTSRPSVNTWHHFAYTFDGTRHRLYLNGSLVSSSTTTPDSAPVANCELGRWPSNTLFYRGMLDDVRIYNRALAQSEVQTIRGQSLSGSSAAVMMTTYEGTESPSRREAATRVRDRSEGTSTSSEAASGNGRNRAPSRTSRSREEVPQVSIDLNKANYSAGDVVGASSFLLVNPGTKSRSIEMKTWLSSPGRPPVSVGNIGADGLYVMPPGVQEEYGPMDVLSIDPESSTGIYEFSSRLIDPVTGDLIAEDLNPFSVLGDGWEASAVDHSGFSPLAITSRAESMSVSARDFVQATPVSIRNDGAAPIALEVKMWLQAGGRIIPLLSLGSDGALMLDSMAELPVQPAAAQSDAVQPGRYTLRCRAVDAVTGQLLADYSHALTLR